MHHECTDLTDSRDALNYNVRQLQLSFFISYQGCTDTSLTHIIYLRYKCNISDITPTSVKYFNYFMCVT